MRLNGVILLHYPRVLFFFALIYIVLYLLGRLKSLRSLKFQEQISIEVNVICSTAGGLGREFDKKN